MDNYSDEDWAYVLHPIRGKTQKLLGRKISTLNRIKKSLPRNLLTKYPKLAFEILKQYEITYCKVSAVKKFSAPKLKFYLEQMKLIRKKSEKFIKDVEAIEKIMALPPEKNRYVKIPYFFSGRTQLCKYLIQEFLLSNIDEDIEKYANASHLTKISGRRNKGDEALNYFFYELAKVLNPKQRWVELLQIITSIKGLLKIKYEIDIPEDLNASIARSEAAKAIKNRIDKFAKRLKLPKISKR